MSTPEQWCSAAPAPSVPDAGVNGKLIEAAPSALCSMNLQPVMITGILRDVITRHFADPPGIETADLQALLWRPGERTGIVVESVFRWLDELVGKQPAVLIKSNGRHNVRLMIGDKATTTPSGQQTYETYWLGSHTVFCIHGTGIAAEILAIEVQRELTEFAPELIHKLPGLMNFQVTEVGGPAEVEEARHSWGVPITVGWVYKEHWRLDTESPKLRSIELATLLDGAVIQETKQ